MTTRQDLMNIKSRALRTKIWFKALSRVERAIINLTIKCVEKVRSNILAGAISEIVDKICQFLEETFMTRAEKAGHQIVEKICNVGKRWGNQACSAWKCDKSFKKFLGVNSLNT